MFRRSRFSVRPNVGAVGRAAATPQEAPSSNQEANETPRDVSESSTPIAVTDTTSFVTPSEKTTTPGDGSDQNGDGTSSSAAVQRRKRFAVKPKVASGRPSTLSRTSKSPVKAVSDTPVEVSISDHDKLSTSSQAKTSTDPQGLHSSKRRRPAGVGKPPKVQPKATPGSSEHSGSLAVSLPEESPEQTTQPTDLKQSTSNSDSQFKDASLTTPEKVPPSLPDKEADEISEKAMTLVSSQNGLSLSPSALSLSRLLNDQSDLHRLAKAQKLRELLRHEKHKEKNVRKAKARIKEYSLDPTKMTMRDLIHYLPVSNPMTSSLEDLAQENETVVPPSPGREQSPERVQEPEVPPKVVTQGEDEEEASEEEEQDALMVPRVKVAEDGTLIIDEESLTVEVQRAKGPNPAQDRDPIFERGSTTTYSSFRKTIYSKPWSSEETDMFYLAVSMVGTDFSMICQLFPHRARSEIKNKFKKEERENVWRVDKAFRERRKLDIEYFSKLLQKVLEVQQTRKKLKSLTKKNYHISKRKSKYKKAARKQSDDEEEDEDDSSEVPDLEDEEEEEEEGEKENEEVYNESGTPVSKPKTPRKRKARQDNLNEELIDKKKKTDEKINEKGEPCTPEDMETALSEDHSSADRSENVNQSTDTAIKPAKLSRGRAPKPLLPLGKKWGKKPPLPSTKAKDTLSDNRDDSTCNGTIRDQVSKDSSPFREICKPADAYVSSEEEDITVQPQRPTRYGRVPKPIKALNYTAKESVHSTTSDTTIGSPEGPTASATKPKPKCTGKRGRSSKQQSAQESKKPKLVTLRASQSDYSDEDDEEQQDGKEDCLVCSPSEDGTAPAFVPASLRSPHPVNLEVEETMEELDILANMPDVLGISQDALCPDTSCEQAQNETGIAESCEHQLDLLVDVIDFLSTEHTEVSVHEDESYNEAAQTLLTIGNLTHLPQSAQNQTAAQDCITGSVTVKQSVQELEETDAQKENSNTPLMFGHGDPETLQTIATLEPQHCTTDGGDIPLSKTSEQVYDVHNTVYDTKSGPHLQSGPECPKENSSQTRKCRMSKVKPKPNLGQGSRATKPKSQPDASTEQTPEESNTEISDLKFTESLSASEETTSKMPEYPPTSSVDDISVTKVILTESSGVLSDQNAAENQRHCISDAQREPSGEQLNRDTVSAESDEKCMFRDISSDISEGTPVQEGNTNSATHVTPTEDLVVNQEKEREVTSTCQSRRSRFQKVKPKPNLSQTSRAARSIPQIKEDAVQKDSSSISKLPENTREEIGPGGNCATCPENPIQSSDPASVLTPSFDVALTLSPTEDLPTTKEKRTDEGVVGRPVAPTSCQPASEDQRLTVATLEPSNGDTASALQSEKESSSQSSEPNLLQRRRHLLKVKPNLGSPTRPTRTKLQANNITNPSEQYCKDNSSNIMAEQQPKDNSQTQMKRAHKECKDSDKHCTLNTEFYSTTSAPAESQNRLESLPDLMLEKNSKMSTFQRESTGDKMSSADSVDTELAVQTSAEGSMESNISSVFHSNVHSMLKPQERTHQPCSKSNAEVKSQHAQQCSEPNQASKDISQFSERNVKTLDVDSTTYSTDSPSDMTDLSKSSKKAPLTRRGRLIKPKPNLGRSSKPPQPQQVQHNTIQPDADCAAQSECVKASVSHNPVSERHPSMEQGKEATEPHLNQDYAVPSAECVTEVPDSWSQNTSAISGGTQRHPSLRAFPDMTTEQVPSDPDEQFFILSLTEIPVGSSGEVMDCAAQPFSNERDRSIQSQSDPGRSLETPPGGSHCNAPVSVCTEESGVDAGSDPITCIDSIMENSVDLQAKPQVKSDTKRGEHMPAKTFELPAPPMQPGTSDAKTLASNDTITEVQKTRGYHTNPEKASGEVPKDCSSGAQAQCSKISGKSTVPSGDHSPGKAASKGSKITPHTKKKTKPAASTSRTVHSIAPTLPQQPEETQLSVDVQQTSENRPLLSEPISSTSQCMTEMSSSQHSECEESSSLEITSVSQYFLSDIFTDVEEQ